jgi:hypothetical protein
VLNCWVEDSPRRRSLAASCCRPWPVRTLGQVVSSVGANENYRSILERPWCKVGKRRMYSRNQAFSALLRHTEVCCSMMKCFSSSTEKLRTMESPRLIEEFTIRLCCYLCMTLAPSNRSWSTDCWSKCPCFVSRDPIVTNFSVKMFVRR